MNKERTLAAISFAGGFGLGLGVRIFAGKEIADMLNSFTDSGGMGYIISAAHGIVWARLQKKSNTEFLDYLISASASAIGYGIGSRI